jgi:hypothetical protein
MLSKAQAMRMFAISEDEIMSLLHALCDLLDTRVD